MTCMRDGWECCFVPIVAGTKSMKEEAWNEAMEKFGVAKIRWSGGRARLMRVLLKEHEKVLGSFWAQVLGKGVSLSAYTVRREWLRVRARDEEKHIGWSGSGFRKWEGRKTRR
jgi:hypothetical protein